MKTKPTDFRKAVRTGEEKVKLGPPMPMPGYIMVQQVKTPNVSEGGIELPQTSQEDLPYGMVVKENPYDIAARIEPRPEDRPCFEPARSMDRALLKNGTISIQLGDYVLFPPHAGHLLPDEKERGVQWVFIKRTDIIAVFEAKT